MRKSIISIITVFLIASVILAGCGSKSNELRVYTAFLENEAIEIFKAFEEATGIEVKYVRLGAGEVLARLKAEQNNPQASVWFGGSSDTFIAAANEGLLEKYTAKNADILPKEHTDQNGYWTPVTLGAIGLASNVDWLAENGLDAPQSWAELLQPEFNKNVTTAHPATSGTAFTVLATIVQLFGNEDEGFNYMKDLDQNVLQYTKSGGAPVRMAGLGETGVGFAFSQDIQQAIAEGFPIVMTFPKEGTGYEVSSTALIKDGPKKEVENAKKFIDWAISEEAQAIFANFYRIPVNPNTSVPEGAATLNDIEVIDYDAVWAGANRQALLERFESEVRGQAEAQ